MTEARVTGPPAETRMTEQEKALVRVYDRWRSATLIANNCFQKRRYPVVPLRVPPPLRDAKRIVAFLRFP